MTDITFWKLLFENSGTIGGFMLSIVVIMITFFIYILKYFMRKNDEKTKENNEILKRHFEAIDKIGKILDKMLETQRQHERQHDQILSKLDKI